MMHIQKKTLMAGMVAGMMMAMISMLYELLWGVGFWGPPVFISGFFLPTVQQVALPVVFLIVPILVGITAHIIFSMMLAIPFVAVLKKMKWGRIQGKMLGMSFGLGMFIVMWFVILPIYNPVMLHLNAYAFAFAHLVWGGTLGMIATRHT